MADRFVSREYDKRIDVATYNQMVEVGGGTREQVNAVLKEEGYLPPRSHELGSMVDELVTRLKTEGLGPGGEYGLKRAWEKDLQADLLREPLFIEWMAEKEREDRLAVSDVPWSDIIKDAPWIDSFAQAVGSVRHLPSAVKTLGPEIASAAPKILTDAFRPKGEEQFDMADHPAIRALAEGVLEYGLKDGLKSKVARDPFEPVSDALSLLSMGAGGAAKIPGLGAKMQGVLQGFQRGSNLLDPTALLQNVLTGGLRTLAPGSMAGTGKTDVLAAEGRLQQKGLLGEEGLPASFVSDDPRIFKTEGKLFKGKNRKLFRQLQDFFAAPDRMRESLGTVTPADAGNRIGQAVEDYRQKFHDTSDSMFDSLHGRIRPTADKAAFAAITGSGEKRAAGTRYTPAQMMQGQVPEGLKAVEGKFTATLNKYSELLSYEDEIIAGGGKPSPKLQAVQAFLDDTIPGLTQGEVTDASMALIKQARTTLREQISDMGKMNITPSARSYLQSIQDALTIDLNNSAEAYARKSGDIEFANEYAKINRFYAEGASFLNGEAGKVVYEAIENPGQLDRLVDDLLFKGGRRRTQFLPTPDIASFYKELESVDPGIASELRSAFTIMFLDRSRNPSKGRVTAKNFDTVLNGLDANGNPTSAEVRLRAIVGADVADDLLALRTALEAQEGSALNSERVGRLREGEVAEVASMGLDDLFGPGKSGLNTIANVIFGATRGSWNLARSAVLAVVIGQDQYRRLSDSRKRFGNSRLEPLKDVVKFLDESNLPVRFGLKGGRQIYRKDRSQETHSENALKALAERERNLKADLGAKIEGFDF